MSDETTLEEEIPLPLQMLMKSLEAHGVEALRHKDWLLPFGQLPCVTADWLRRDRLMGTLAVVAHLEDEREVVEVFPGLGEEDGDAIAYAFESFSVGALHEMLAAIWNVRDEEDDDVAEPAEPELWHINGQDYELFEGPWQARGERLSCPELWDRLKSAIEALPLTADLHWFRVFVGGTAGAFTFEALKDSEPWVEGQELLRSLSWESGEKYGSVRNFLMLRKREAKDDATSATNTEHQEKSTLPH